MQDRQAYSLPWELAFGCQQCSVQMLSNLTSTFKLSGIDGFLPGKVQSSMSAQKATVMSQAIAEHANVAKQLHLPAQSGSSSLLQRMRRGHTREAYDALVDSVRAAIPGIALSTDIIAGTKLIRQFHAVSHQA